MLQRHGGDGEGARPERRVSCLLPVYGEGQRARQGGNGRRHSVQPRRAGDGQGCGAAEARKGLQQAGQAQDVVPVVVGEQDVGDTVGADTPAAQGGLSALAAVQQEGGAPHADGEGGQCPVGQRLGAAAAQQCDGDHGQIPLSQQYPNLQGTL